MQGFPFKHGIGCYGRAAAPVQGSYKGPFRLCTDPAFSIRNCLYQFLYQPGSRVMRFIPDNHCQDPLACSGHDFGDGKNPVDPLFKAEPLKPGRCQYQGPVFPLIQLFQPGKHVTPDRRNRPIRVNVSHLKMPPLTGTADRFSFIRLSPAQGENQSVPGIFPNTIGANFKMLLHVHRQILQTVDRSINPALKQGPVQFLDKEPFPPSLAQGFIYEEVAAGLHGTYYPCILRIPRPELLDEEFSLNKGKPTVSAPDVQFPHIRSLVPADGLVCSPVLPLLEDCSALVSKA